MLDVRVNLLVELDAGVARAPVEMDATRVGSSQPFACCRAGCPQFISYYFAARGPCTAQSAVSIYVLAIGPYMATLVLN